MWHNLSLPWLTLSSPHPIFPLPLHYWLPLRWQSQIHHPRPLLLRLPFCHPPPPSHSQHFSRPLDRFQELRPQAPCPLLWASLPNLWHSCSTQYRFDTFWASPRRKLVDTMTQWSHHFLPRLSQGLWQTSWRVIPQSIVLLSAFGIVLMVFLEHHLFVVLCSLVLRSDYPMIILVFLLQQSAKSCQRLTWEFLLLQSHAFGGFLYELGIVRRPGYRFGLEGHVVSFIHTFIQRLAHHKEDLSCSSRQLRRVHWRYAFGRAALTLCFGLVDISQDLNSWLWCPCYTSKRPLLVFCLAFQPYWSISIHPTQDWVVLTFLLTINKF